MSSPNFKQEQSDLGKKTHLQAAHVLCVFVTLGVTVSLGVPVTVLRVTRGSHWILKSYSENWPARHDVQVWPTSGCGRLSFFRKS